jgi:oligopeptide transport system ATP-binding protein
MSDPQPAPRSAPEAGPLLQVRDLRKSFRVPGSKNALCALDGITLDLRRGETLGLVGESGCGKSTLARTLMMLERPDSGTVTFDGIDPFSLRGKDLLKFRRRVQMVFQDPYASLNSRMSAGDIIAEPWRTHKTMHENKHDRDTRVIICDEPVSALDLSVQAQVLNLLNDLQQELQISYVFISHDLSVVRHVADRVSVMYLGRIIEAGSTEVVFDGASHPYTAALVSAAPKLDAAQRKERILLKGEVPSPIDPPSGCRFRTRCWKATDLCASERPPLVIDPVHAEHGAECHHPLAGAASALSHSA